MKSHHEIVEETSGDLKKLGLFGCGREIILIEAI